MSFLQIHPVLPLNSSPHPLHCCFCQPTQSPVQRWTFTSRIQTIPNIYCCLHIRDQRTDRRGQGSLCGTPRAATWGHGRKPQRNQPAAPGWWTPGLQGWETMCRIYLRIVPPTLRKLGSFSTKCCSRRCDARAHAVPPALVFLGLERDSERHGCMGEAMVTHRNCPTKQQMRVGLRALGQGTDAKVMGFYLR